jgi:nucleoside-diphosphate-sugar epimerase
MNVIEITNIQNQNPPFDIYVCNVYGNDYYSNNFITSILKDALTKNKIVFRTTPTSAKDYIDVKDVSTMLIKLADQDCNGIFNLAFGRNHSNQDIIDVIQKNTNGSIEYDKRAEEIIFPIINTSKLEKEIKYSPKNYLLDNLEQIIKKFKIQLANET